MASSPMTTHRVAAAKIPFRVSAVTSVPRIDPTSPHTHIDDGRSPARGILFGLLLCVPFWVGVLAILF
jgi:hypothetical protein